MNRCGGARQVVLRRPAGRATRPLISPLRAGSSPKCVESEFGFIDHKSRTRPFVVSTNSCCSSAQEHCPRAIGLSRVAQTWVVAHILSLVEPFSSHASIVDCRQ